MTLAKLLFYSKPDCPLCDEGFEKVKRLAQRHRLEVEKVNLESDPQLFEKHRHRVPVVLLGETELGWGRLSERALELKLSRACSG
jgi:glutaredoxin